MMAVSIVPMRHATKNIRVILDEEQRKRLGAALKALRVSLGLHQIQVAKLARHLDRHVANHRVGRT
jgi:hypothetical protein